MKKVGFDILIRRADCSHAVPNEWHSTISHQPSLSTLALSPAVEGNVSNRSPPPIDRTDRQAPSGFTMSGSTAFGTCGTDESVLTFNMVLLSFRISTLSFVGTSGRRLRST
jgi:hypothetical protein